MEVHYQFLLSTFGAEFMQITHRSVVILAQQNYFSLVLIFALRCVKRDFHFADLASHKKRQ